MKEYKNNFDLDVVYLDDEIGSNAQLNDDFGNDYEQPPVKSRPPARKKKTRKRGNRKLMPSLPVGKAVKGTGKLAYRIIGFGFRLATFILISYILHLLFTNFWAGKNAYGSLMKMISERNYTLAAYISTALIIIFYEFISLIWSFTAQKTKEDYHVRKLDTGRGFCSFILIYAGSLVSGFFAHKLPASPAFFAGIEGALTIYGSMTEILLPLCAAGVICSLLRKFIFH